MEQRVDSPTATRTVDRVVTISAGARVTKAAQVMHDNKVGCLVVVDEWGDLVGIVSERDVLKWVSAATPESYFAKVGDVMTTEVATCTPETPAEESYRIMLNHRIRHLPIIQDRRPVGMISVRDLLGKLQAG